MFRKFFALFLFLCLAGFTAAPADAEQGGRLRAFLEKRRAGGDSGDDMTRAVDDETGMRSSLSCERMAQMVNKRASRKPADKQQPDKTFKYGEHAAQALDVYLPSKPAHDAPYPVLFMVHGGAWCIGGKDMGKVVTNKIARWLDKGFIFVSINYRMLPDKADVVAQAADVATALAYVQKHAAEWQGNPDRIIIMGHSAGAHLVSLIGADAETTAGFGVKPWLGTVSLDSAALDIPEKMKVKHAGFYDDAFGADETFWTKVSPVHHLSKSSLPWLGVCSSTRKDSCPAAHVFAEKAKALGIKAEVLEEPRKHGAINGDLGLDGDYTDAVEKFMAGLDADVKARLE
ncbi:MAG: alpha/beta hydrolase [bacterium]|nr:alpha/beta hydrolase [bacterium]